MQGNSCGPSIPLLCDIVMAYYTSAPRPEGCGALVVRELRTSPSRA